MKLILIRHCETDYTIKKRYCGSINPPLNKYGIKQAHRLKRLLNRQKIDIACTSPLKRTLQTARIIFKDKPVKMCKEPLLRESHLGKWEGLTLEEVKQRFPEDVKKWYADPLNYGATRGETPVILQRRVKRFLKKLILFCKQNPCVKIVAIVTHSGPFRIIIGEMNGNGLQDFWKLAPKTGEYKVMTLCPRN
ncbi:MAG: histidine phosphatase family protein [Planctomycetota bacterium]|nr:histidine phosphatase family protein [Planctomycetota bacterium]MDI6787044.1 histidine phosphatase family protein [Planctomycetota bacterium]